MLINGVKFGEPLRVPPTLGMLYYVPSLQAMSLTSACIWQNSRIDHLRLNRGLVHRARRDALAHAEALLSFSR